MKQTILIQRIEGLVVATASAAYFVQQDFAWYWLLVIFLIFDISMLGYVHHERTGALTYNVIHNYALPLSLVLLSTAFNWQLGTFLGLTWLFHVGVDRSLGFGLKHGAFKDTHLSKLQ